MVLSLIYLIFCFKLRFKEPKELSTVTWKSKIYIIIYVPYKINGNVFK